MVPLRLVFLGPPGTGKGTQARRLAESHRLAALSSGDVLRAEIERDSEVGRKAAQYVRSGTLVPDDVICEVMLAAIDRLEAGRGFILDGFPRTVPQAEALDEGLAQRGVRLDAVLLFELDDEAVLERIVNRRICKKCGATYNVKFLPPRTEGVCDACGGPLVERVDDREEVVRTRLATYREQTQPLVAYYEGRGLLHRVDASRSAEQVEAAIRRRIDELGAGG